MLIYMNVLKNITYDGIYEINKSFKYLKYLFLSDIDDDLSDKLLPIYLEKLTFCECKFDSNIFNNLRNLKELNINRCFSINILNLIQLKTLKKIFISKTIINELYIPKNVDLNIENRNNIKKIIFENNSIFKLEISCLNIKDIPAYVEELDIDYSVGEITKIKNLPLSIKKFKSYYMPSYIKIKQFLLMKNIDTIYLNMSAISNISQLPSCLIELSLDQCFYITDFTILSSMTSLKILNLNKTKFSDLNIIPKSIEELYISYCDNIDNFNPLLNLVNLKIIDVTCCDNDLTNILPYLNKNIEKIIMRNCIINNINIFNDFIKLKFLFISTGCNIQPIHNYTVYFYNGCYKYKEWIMPHHEIL